MAEEASGLDQRPPTPASPEPPQRFSLLAFLPPASLPPDSSGISLTLAALSAAPLAKSALGAPGRPCPQRGVAPLSWASSRVQGRSQTCTHGFWG